MYTYVCMYIYVLVGCCRLLSKLSYFFGLLCCLVVFKQDGEKRRGNETHNQILKSREEHFFDNRTVLLQNLFLYLRCYYCCQREFSIFYACNILNS